MTSRMFLPFSGNGSILIWYVLCKQGGRVIAPKPRSLSLILLCPPRPFHIYFIICNHNTSSYLGTIYTMVENSNKCRPKYGYLGIQIGECTGAPLMVPIDI